jgi:hypothetical protein
LPVLGIITARSGSNIYPGKYSSPGSWSVFKRDGARCGDQIVLVDLEIPNF